jgi:hypothetical protein
MDQVLNILLGAVIASIVPIITLIVGHEKWKKEKRIEILRLKHDKLERMYSEILLKLSEALEDMTWNSDTTSKVSVYGSKLVRDTYFDFVKIEDKDELKKKQFYLNMCNACHKHLNEIHKKIEESL